MFGVARSQKMERKEEKNTDKRETFLNNFMLDLILEYL